MLCSQDLNIVEHKKMFPEHRVLPTHIKLVFIKRLLLQKILPLNRGIHQELPIPYKKNYLHCCALLKGKLHLHWCVIFFHMNATAFFTLWLTMKKTLKKYYTYFYDILL